MRLWRELNLALLATASSADVKVQFRIRITKGGQIAVGPGKIALLEAIEETGSISAAARKLEMSYRRAWLLVDAMNHSFKQPVVDTAVGGEHGGGTSVTALGKDVMRRYRAIEAQARTAVALDLRDFLNLLSD